MALQKDYVIDYLFESLDRKLLKYYYALCFNSEDNPKEVDLGAWAYGYWIQEGSIHIRDRI